MLRNAEFEAKLLQEENTVRQLVRVWRVRTDRVRDKCPYFNFIQATATSPQPLESNVVDPGHRTSTEEFNYTGNMKCVNRSYAQ